MDENILVNNAFCAKLNQLTIIFLFVSGHTFTICILFILEVIDHITNTSVKNINLIISLSILVACMVPPLILMQLINIAAHLRNLN